MNNIIAVTLRLPARRPIFLAAFTLFCPLLGVSLFVVLVLRHYVFCCKFTVNLHIIYCCVPSAVNILKNLVNRPTNFFKVGNEYRVVVGLLGLCFFDYSV